MNEQTCTRAVIAPIQDGGNGSQVISGHDPEGRRRAAAKVVANRTRV